MADGHKKDNARAAFLFYESVYRERYDTPRAVQAILSFMGDYEALGPCLLPPSLMC